MFREVAAVRNQSGWSMAAIALAAIFAGGCDRARNVDGPVVLAASSAATPEAKLGRVMEQLRSAIDEAQAAQGSGVISRRSCSHRFLAPAGEESRPTAEVTIETQVQVARSFATDAAETAILGEEDEPKKGEDQEEEPVPATAPAQAKRAAGKVIKDSQQTKSDKFMLAYQNDRWELATELSADQTIERLLFQSALGRDAVK